MRRVPDPGIVLVAALLALPAGALAQAQQQQQEVAPDNPEKEKKVCRTEKMTGSLTRRTRICMTVAEWRELNDRTKRGINEMNSAAAGGKVCMPNPADPFQGCPG